MISENFPSLNSWGHFGASRLHFPGRPAPRPISRLRPPLRSSRESLGAELGLRRWGRGDVGLPGPLLTHFLPGSGPSRGVVGSSPTSRLVSTLEPGAGLIRQLTSPRRGAVAHLELHHGGLSAGLSSCSAGNGPLSVIVRNGSWGPGRTKMWDLGSPEGLCGGNAKLWGGGLGSDQAWGLRSEEREPIP